MLVKDLIKFCYDTVVIYSPYDDEILDFKDLYKGNKDNIPSNLLESPVRCFGAKRKGIIDISI